MSKNKDRAESPLTPPDLKRCQAVAQTYNPMAFGSCHRENRCQRVSVYIAKETKPASDGKRGSMSLCAACSKIALEKLGKAAFTLTKIRVRATKGTTHA